MVSHFSYSDATKINPDDFKYLNEALSRAGYKFSYWYAIPNTRKSEIDLDYIIEQTGAISDSEQENKRAISEYDLKKINLVPEDTGLLKKMFDQKRNIEICVHNPQNPLTKVDINKKRKKTANLVQMDGLGIGNTYDARINFEKGTAFLNEEDQDIVHKLSMIYTPTGMMEADPLKASDFELHKDKPRKDEKGDQILYCDNICCKKRVRNPVLFIDKETGGLYHSETCFSKDMKIKNYLAQEKGIDLQPTPIKVSLEEALKMYEKGELQQSINSKNKEKWRNVDVWPEAAFLFPLI